MDDGAWLQVNFTGSFGGNERRRGNLLDRCADRGNLGFFGQRQPSLVLCTYSISQNFNTRRANDNENFVNHFQVVLKNVLIWYLDSS